MAQEITYDSEEIIEIENILDTSEKLFTDEIKQDLTNDFAPLKDLGFTGLTVVQNQSTSLSNSHNSFSKELKSHDQNLTSLESSIDEKIKMMIDNKSIENTNNASDEKDLEEIDLNEVTSGQPISSAQLSELIAKFTYSSKVGILNNILNFEVSNVTSMVTDPEKSNILVYELRQMLNDDETDISIKATDEEKKLQKELLNSIAKEEENPFREVEEDSFLRGLPYFKKMAELNNLEVADLIIDKENEKLLNDCIKYIYDHSSVNGLTESDIASVKEYVDKIASKNNMSPTELFNSSSCISLIKEGV